MQGLGGWGGRGGGEGGADRCGSGVFIHYEIPFCA